MIPESISHYRVAERLGGGGMGEVYSAEDTKLGRRLALKFLPESLSRDRQAVERFKREARAASSLNHPHICTIYEVDEHDGQPFIAMELLEGQTLRQRIEERPMPPGEVLELAIQIADGLVAAHEKGIIHRDIKPANVFITKRGQAKLLDFGLAKLAQAHQQPAGPPGPEATPTESAAETSLTLHGAAVGTVAYMSPEQARGEEVDARSDLFSLGGVMYEMATGRPPFQGNTLALTYDALLHRQPEPVSQRRPEMPAGWDAVIERALAKDRTLRYGSAKDLLADLQRLKQGIAVSKPRSRRWLHVMVAAVLVLLFVLAAPTSFRWFGRFLGPRLPARMSVAVTPFQSIGDIPSGQEFCDGLAEELSSRLTPLERFHETLLVVPFSEVRTRGVKGIRDAYQVFNVQLVITGTLQRRGDQYRLHLYLHDAPNVRQIESRMLDAADLNSATFPERSIYEVAGMLELHLQTDEYNVLAAGKSSVAEAQSAYLKARGNLQRYDVPEKLDAAIQLFKDAIRRDPRYALAYAGLGEAYLHKYESSPDSRLLEEASEAGVRARELDGGLEAVHVTGGLIHTARGKCDLAVEDFKRALQIDRRSSEAYGGLAEAYQCLGNMAEAESTYRKAISLRPDFWPGYNQLGGFYMARSRFQEAIAQYQKVIQLAPNSVWGYSNLGGAYFYLDRRDDARTAFEKALEIAPDFATLSNLATLYFGEERYADAARMYERAIELNDRRYSLWGNLAAAYHWMTGREEDAARCYRKALELAGEQLAGGKPDAAIIVDIAHFEIMLGNRAGSEASLKKALDLDRTNARVLYTAALVREQQGDRDQAFQLLEKALSRGLPVGRIEHARAFRDLRADPRYRRMLSGRVGKK